MENGIITAGKIDGQEQQAQCNVKGEACSLDVIQVSSVLCVSAPSFIRPLPPAAGVPCVDTTICGMRS